MILSRSTSSMLYKNLAAHHLQRLKQEVDTSLTERRRRSEERVQKHLEQQKQLDGVPKERERALKERESHSKDVRSTSSRSNTKAVRSNISVVRGQSSISKLIAVKKSSKASKVVHKTSEVVPSQSSSILDLIPETWDTPSSPPLVLPTQFYSKHRTSDNKVTEPSPQAVKLAEESERIKKIPQSTVSFDSQLAQIDCKSLSKKKRVRSRTVSMTESDVKKAETKASKVAAPVSKKPSKPRKDKDKTAAKPHTTDKTNDGDGNSEPSRPGDRADGVLNDSSGSDCIIVGDSYTEPHSADNNNIIVIDDSISSANDTIDHNIGDLTFMNTEDTCLGGMAELFSTSTSSVIPGVIPGPDALSATALDQPLGSDTTNHFNSDFDLFGINFDPVSFLTTDDPLVEKVSKPKRPKMDTKAESVHKPASVFLTNLTEAAAGRVKPTQQKMAPKPKKVPKRIVDKAPPKPLPKPTFSVLKKKEVVFNGK